MVVMVFSPPERSVMERNSLPGGHASTSMPASRTSDSSCLQHQVAAAAAEQPAEGLLEILPDFLEGLLELLAADAVELADDLLQDPRRP